MNPFSSDWWGQNLGPFAFKCTWLCHICPFFFFLTQDSCNRLSLDLCANLTLLCSIRLHNNVAEAPNGLTLMCKVHLCTSCLSTQEVVRLRHLPSFCCFGNLSWNLKGHCSKWALFSLEGNSTCIVIHDLMVTNTLQIPFLAPVGTGPCCAAQNRERES